MRCPAEPSDDSDDPEVLDNAINHPGREDQNSNSPMPLIADIDDPEETVSINRALDGVLVCRAVVQGDIEVVRAFVERRPELLRFRCPVASPLFLAVEHNQEAIFQWLLARGAPADLEHTNGFTPLQLASLQGQMTMVSGLVSSGVPVDHRHRQGHTAIMCAAQQGFVEIVRFLHQHRADVNTQDYDGHTALILGISHVTVTRCLLELGADATLTTKFGTDAMKRALVLGHIDTAEILANHLGDQATAFVHGSLVVSCAHGALAAVIWILARGLPPSSTLVASLLTAIHENEVECVRLLLDAGMSAQTTVGRVSALHFACDLEREAVVDLLTERGAEVNAYDADGDTPLCVASMKGCVSIVRHLLAAGANLWIGSLTPLQRAVTKGHRSVVDVLLDTAACVEEADQIPDRVNQADPAGRTALFVACGKGFDPIVRRLLAAGANPHQCNGEGITPLMIASGSGHSSVVRQLMAAGVDLQVTSSRGHTARDLARSGGHADIVTLLSNRPIDIYLRDLGPSFVEFTLPLRQLGAETSQDLWDLGTEQDLVHIGIPLLKARRMLRRD